MRVIAIVLALVLALPAQAEKLSLNAISQYLNGLRVMQGAFSQINDDGTVSTGTIKIKRPGRMRFEYNPPDSTLVVVGSQTVLIVDTRSNQPPESYPLNRTPLSIILARNVDLGRANMVTGHAFDGTATVVTAQDPENPEYGNIQMLFTANPVELRQWVINDGDGNTTTVILGETRTGGNIPNREFDIQRYREGGRN